MAGACILIARFCHHQTKGFALSKISGNFPLENPSLENQLTLPPTAVCKFDQKFRFLGRGAQSFVFVSEDNQIILKLFNNRYQKKISFLSFLCNLPLIKNWALKQKELFEKKLENSFTSYQLAFDEMADQTALLYLHLNPTSDLPHKLTLVDPLNISHQIDPNQFAFLFQKKVEMVYPSLQNWITSGKEEMAKRAIASLIQLFIWKWEHSIEDNDPLIRTNYGFLDTQAIQIDVGPLSKRDELEEKTLFKQEIARIMSSLKNWLAGNAPQLLSYLDQELDGRLSSQACLD